MPTRADVKLDPEEQHFAHLLMKDTITKEEERELERFQREYRRVKADRFLKRFITPLLVHAEITGWGSMGSPKWLHRSARLSALASNDAFKDSQYDYPLTADSRFIHYTTPQTLLSMLRETSIRLYDLNHMDDPREFTFAAKDLGFADGYSLKEARSKLFSFSMVEIDQEGTTEDFNLWQYGGNGHGVAIVFSIDPTTQRHWNNYHLSRIQYSIQEPEAFIGLAERIREFGHAENFHVRDFEDLFVKLVAFHKSDIFRFENEVRLLHYHDHDFFSRPSENKTWPKDLSLDVGRNGQRSFFDRLYLGKNWETRYQLPPTIDPDGTAKSLIPRLKIERVILGYRLKPSNVRDLCESIHQLAHEKLGETFEIRPSRFFEHFNRHTPN
ncbi:MAG: DUF2971 domain-containing protein [Flavobacteriales bacterium]|nr:DUF2971 domain-containing protein [Flavobacteriales bacterium]